MILIFFDERKNVATKTTLLSVTFVGNKIKLSSTKVKERHCKCYTKNI